MRTKKILSVLAVLVIFMTAFSGCKKVVDNPKATDKPDTAYGTLVLGSTEFNGVFNPFFATTAYDVEVAGLTQVKILGNDRLGTPVSAACVYQTPVEVKDSQGNVTQTVYTFKLIDDLKFSDGTKVTADDIIFTYMVYCDPMYDGAATLFATPILGVNEYRYDDNNYKSKIAEIAATAAAYEPTDAEIDATAQALADTYAAYGYTKANFIKGGDCYDSDTVVTIRADKQKTLEAEYVAANLAGGTDVPAIEGIKKIDDRTVQVTIEGVDPTAIWNLGGVQICSKSYYSPNFKKGDLSEVKAKNSAPMGAGAYKFVSFKDNVVTLEANAGYYKGAPSIAKIKYQVVDTSDKFEGVKLGDYDISDPPASTEMVEQCKATENIDYRLVDYLGYGYIGINAKRITDVNVRKGLMSLMNRDPAIQSYFGELATVIERPMSKVSWAYPENANRVYAFDTEKALEYFQKAGYEQVQKNGKTVLEKDGKQLSVQIAIGGDGKMDHPAAPILTQMKLELEKLGGALDIQDVDMTILSTKMQTGEWDMWVAAWETTIDPDIYQLYHSQGATNYYGISNAQLDKLIVEARQTNDISDRKEKYAAALDIIMDEAIEMPLYQRKNMYIFNNENIDVTTLPEDMTPFYGYLNGIENIHMITKQ